MADKLAKDGRAADCAGEELPGQDAKLFIKKTIWNAWQQEWSSSNPGTQLNTIKETVYQWTDRTNQYEQKILTRIRIGHSRITHDYLFTPYSDFPICSTCNCKLTIKHVLLDCKKYNRCRKAIGINGTLNNLLQNDKQHEDKIISFVKAIDLNKLL